MPDMVFAFHGTDWYVDAHTVWPQFWSCLPATIAGTWIVKTKVAAVLGTHLPDLGGFHLRYYRLLGQWRTPRTVQGWLAIILSALLGSWSHIVLDSFTHGFGWVVQRAEFLHRALFDLPTSLSSRTVYVHDVLQIVATIVGVLITIACLRRIGRDRLLLHWYRDRPSPTPTTESRRRLWTSTTIGLAGGIIVAVLTIHVGGPQDLIIRIADLTLVGLLVGCVIAAPAMTPADDHG